MIFGTSSIIDRAISSFSIVSSLIEVFYLIFGIVILIKQNRDIVQNINDRVNNQRNQNVTQTQVNSILSPDILMIEHFDDDRNLSGNDSNLTINFSTQTENRNSFYYAYDFEDLSLSKKKELELEDIQDMQCEISPYGLGKDKYYPPEIENDGKQIEGIPNIQKDIMSNPYSTAGTNNLATFGNYIV